jgi:quercetin dioxygenase-like cupin family protein
MLGHSGQPHLSGHALQTVGWYAKMTGQLTVSPICNGDKDAIGNPIPFPRTGAEVAVSVYELPSHTILPLHRHMFPRLTYVLTGAIHMTTSESRVSRTYCAGELMIEPVGQWHRCVSAESEQVRLLVIDLVSDSASNIEFERGAKDA